MLGLTSSVLYQLLLSDSIKNLFSCGGIWMTSGEGRSEYPVLEMLLELMLIQLTEQSPELDPDPESYA